MKKIFTIFILSIIMLVSISLPILAKDEELSKLYLKVEDIDEDYELYILLPQKYIKYAIEYDGLDIEYDGANTLKYHSIPSIVVNVNDIQDKTYIDNRIEYVQIKLQEISSNEYLFEIIPEYEELDMMYRIKTKSKDNLMVINNFTMRDNKCKMVYNYKNDTIIKLEDTEMKFEFHLSWWQIVLIIILIIGVTWIEKRRRA